MKKLIFTLMVALFMTACSTSQKEQNENFSYTVDAFADMQILRYRVPQVEALSVRQKELLYYLTEAALNGRDILYDQNGKYNLLVRRTLEAVYTNYDGDKNTADFCAFETYLKRVNDVTGAIFSRRSLPLISSISTRNTNSLIFTL